MLRLESLVLNNFKSFRHARINFSSGFNCVVGPNGSGKSNICDSILFALGELSQKRMRVNSYLQLINNSAKPGEDGLKKANVKLLFTGDAEIEVSKTIASNNKVKYRLNGVRSTRQEILDMLHMHKSEISEVNTIAQGEIVKFLELDSKERRELIEIAAGIKEFNDKKASSIKELEKVESKINEANIMLHERLGFLKDLEKEKNDAEEYIKLSTAVKSMNYTVLKQRESQAEEEYKKSSESRKEKAALKESLNAKILELDSKMSTLSKNKEAEAKKLNEHSIELGNTNRKLDEIGKQIAVTESNIAAIRSDKGKSEGNIESLRAELSAIEEKLKANALLINNLEKELSSAESKIIEVQDGQDYTNYQKDFDAARLAMGEAEAKLKDATSRLAALRAESAGYVEQVSAVQARISDFRARLDKLGAEEKSISERLASSKAAAERARAKFAESQKSKADARKELDRLNAEVLTLKEQLAYAGGSSDRIGSAIGAAITEGFFGRALDLCDIEKGYENAVFASSSARLNYFVVDTIDTADRAITIIKQKHLGRATFIPIKEIAVPERDNSSMDPLITHVRFDKKYEKAFRFIFSNTYVIGSVAESKKAGLGKHRYVTLDGELIEPSGTISGGEVKKLQNPSMIEKRIASIELERKAASQRAFDIEESTATITAEIGKREAEAVGLELDLKQVKAEIERISSTLGSDEEKLRSIGKMAAECDDNAKKAAAEAGAFEERTIALKAEYQKAYDRMNRAISGMSKKVDSETARAQKELKKNADKLKIDIATLTKENEMHTVRARELESQIKKERDYVDNLTAKLSGMEKSRKEMKREYDEISNTVKTSDKLSESLYNSITEIDKQLSGISFERGASMQKIERLSSDIMELEGRMMQSQTRLSDIKAELVNYANVTAIEGKTMEQLGEELARAKARIDGLGAVNLKAPEVYESKRKDVDEAQSKLSTLDAEKASILAMIDEIEAKKLAVFMETFNAVNENFKNLHEHVFGETASIRLSSMKNPFEAGLIFDIKSGKSSKNPESLSGGEKSLVMLTLLFAIQMRNPMAFYIFDEIDTALDKENSKKLSKLIKELSSMSQFIVVSHNDPLITSADTAIGVMNDGKESRAVGIQMVSKKGGDSGEERQNQTV